MLLSMGYVFNMRPRRNFAKKCCNIAVKFRTLRSFQSLSVFFCLTSFYIHLQSRFTLKVSYFISSSISLVIIISISYYHHIYYHNIM